jgi:hypothetical protein
LIFWRLSWRHRAGVCGVTNDARKNTVRAVVQVGEEHVVAAQLRSPRLPLISSLLPHDTEPTELMVARHLLFAGMHECRDGLRARLLVVPATAKTTVGHTFATTRKRD